MPVRRQTKQAQLRITGAIFIDGEQKPQAGEDAGLAYWLPGAGVFACLDGCGGSGAMRYAEADGRTGARLAANIAGMAVKDWLIQSKIREYGIDSAPAEIIAGDLHKAVSYALNSANGKLRTNSVMRGSLSKSLPTTLAVLVMDTLQSPARNLFLWTGDSRGYLFTPSEGLMQMTADDVQGNMDAQENLLRDGVLTNVASAGAPFRVHTQEAYCDEPYLALVATDGCFAYFRSPMELESTLLSTLLASDSPCAWEAQMEKAFGAFASDDFTLRLAIVGFDSFSAIVDAFRPRAAQFHRDYRVPMQQMLLENDTQGLEQLWKRYKKSYDRGPKRS